MSNEYINILLVGKTGAGKSSTANTILGDKVFDTKAGKSVTKRCYGKPATIFGKKVQVIDAPGFCDTDNLDTAVEIDSYLLHNIDGIHVVALVLSAANRPTTEEIAVIKALENQFGSDMLKFLLIIVTRADDLEDDKMELEEFVRAYEGEAKEILRECCSLKNVIGFDNKNKDKRQEQVKALLKKVELLVELNQGSFYTRAMLKKKNEENRRIEEERQRKIKEEENAKRRKEAEYEKAKKQLEESQANEKRLCEDFDKAAKKMKDELRQQKEEEEKRREEDEERQRKAGEEMREMQSKLRDNQNELEHMRLQTEKQKREHGKEQERLREEVNRQEKEHKRMLQETEELIRKDKIERERKEKERLRDMEYQMEDMQESHRRSMQKMNAKMDDASRRPKDNRENPAEIIGNLAITGLAAIAKIAEDE